MIARDRMRERDGEVGRESTILFQARVEQRCRVCFTLPLVLLIF